MPDRHPAVAHLLAAHERAVVLAAAGTPGPWEPEGDDPTDDEVYTVHDGEHGDLVGDVVAYVRGGGWRGKPWTAVANMGLIATFADPVAVLLRVAEERNILAERDQAKAKLDEALANPDQVHPADAGICIGKFNALTRAVVGLAKAWGWDDQGDAVQPAPS